MATELDNAKPPHGNAPVPDGVTTEREPEAGRQVVQGIVASLQRIKETGSPDPRLYGGLEELRKFLQKAKDRWLGCPDSSGLSFSEAVQDTVLILDSVGDRFKDSKEPADIRKTAKDSLAIMPHIRDVLDATDVDQPTDTSLLDITDKLDCLLDVADGAGLTAALDAEMAKFDDRSQKIVAEHLVEAIDRALVGDYKNKHE